MFKIILGEFIVNLLFELISSIDSLIYLIHHWMNIFVVCTHNTDMMVENIRLNLTNIRFITFVRILNGCHHGRLMFTRGNSTVSLGGRMRNDVKLPTVFCRFFGFQYTWHAAPPCIRPDGIIVLVYRGLWPFSFFLSTHFSVFGIKIFRNIIL